MKYSPSCCCLLSWLYQSCSSLICSLAILTICSNDSVSARSNPTAHTLHLATICHSPSQSNLVPHQRNRSSNQTTVTHVPHQEKSRHNSHKPELERRVGLDQPTIRRQHVANDTGCLVAHHEKIAYNLDMNIIHEIATAIENRDEDRLYQLSGDMPGMLITEHDRAAYEAIINGALEMMGELEVA